MRVEEIMTKKIEYIKHDATVYDAMEKMVDKRLRSLVVEPEGEEDVSGVITVRDIAFKVIGKNLDPKKIKVEEITSKPLVCINKDMTMEHVLALMEKFNIARVFVCGDNRTIGVVSLLDIMAGSLIKRAREGRGV